MLLLGIYLIETKALSWRGSCIPMFVVTSLTIAKTWKQAKCPWRNNAQRKSGIYTQWNIRFSSVFQSCLTLCNLMDCGTPGFPVHHQLSELTQTHVHWIGDTIEPSHPLSTLLSPSSIFPCIRDFSNESVLLIRWPKYWSFSFSIGRSNEYSGLISFMIDWYDLLAIWGTLKSLL